MEKGLFRIEGFVEDKNLAKVKRLLLGLVIELKDQPVVNAVKMTSHNGPKIRAKTNGSAAEMVREYCQKKKLTEIDAHIARGMAKELGYKPDSYTWVLKKAVDDGVLAKQGAGTKTRYRVT